MIYYKLSRDGSVIAVATSDDLRKYQKTHNIPVLATPEEAEFIQVHDDFFRGSWMRETDAAFFNIVDVDIVGIQEEEYTLLRDALQSDAPEEAVAQIYAVPEPEPSPEPMDFEKSTIDVVRQSKLREVSLACQNAIISGFDLADAEGVKHHYSLTAQDQSNLQSVQLQLLRGDLCILYHADGEEARQYSSSEISSVINAAESHKAYHLIYHNALKGWIKALRRATTISKVYYGSEIPEKYQTAALKQLIEMREEHG